MFRTRTFATDPDPDLQTALDSGPDGDFVEGIALMRTLLETKDVTAFWFQAVGDGTPFASSATDPLTQVTPHQVSHIAGYSESLRYPAVREAATGLCAHHLGVVSNPASEGLLPKTILQEASLGYTDYAEQLLASRSPLDDDYPPTGDFETHRERALSLLNEPALTLCWLQVVYEDPDLLRLQFGPADQANRSGEWGVTELPIETVEFVQAAYDCVDFWTIQQVGVELFAQHLIVAASTADRDIEVFSSEVADLPLERGWIYDTISPL